MIRRLSPAQFRLVGKVLSICIKIVPTCSLSAVMTSRDLSYTTSPVVSWLDVSRGVISVRTRFDMSDDFWGVGGFDDPEMFELFL